MHPSQHKYVQGLLASTNVLDSKPAHTPGMLGRTFSQHDGPSFLDIKLDCSTDGALQYVTLTRPNIAFAVNKVCQFMANLIETHLLIVIQIIRYLKGTSNYGLQLHQANSLDLQRYTDADWASCLDDCQSTSGHCLFLRPNLISWSSTKQRLVSYSSEESEYRGLDSLTSKIIWVQSMLQELCLSPFAPPLFQCDNQSAAHMATNPVFHARFKHIKLDHVIPCEKLN